MKIEDIKNIVLTFIFFIPFTLLIFDPNVLFPYITTKAIIFRILITVSLSFVFYLFLLDKNPIEKLKSNYLFLSLVLFFLIYSLSGFLGLNPFRSFWGNAERMEGIWSLLFYVFYFFILYVLFTYDSKLKKTIFYSFLIVSSLISIIEIYQYFTLGAQRPSATLGNPTYIGFFNLLMSFILLYFIFEEKNSLNKFFYYLILFLNLFSLLTSETRGSLLGLISGIIAFSFYYLLFSKIEKTKKIKIFTLSFFTLLIFAFLVFYTPLASKLPGFNRLNETLKNPVSIFPRIFAWKIFFDGFKSRPILGYGPETEPIVFFKFFDVKIYEYEAAIFDRPHNKFVQILVNSGILGIISFFLIFLSFFYFLFKNKDLNLLQKASLTGFVFAYLVQNFSLFDMQASYLVFFFGLSLVYSKWEYKFDKEKFIRPYIILVSGLSLIFLTFHIQHYYILYKMIQTSKNPDSSYASTEFLKLASLSINPFLTEQAIHNTYSYFVHHLEKGSFKSLEDIYILKEVMEKAYQKEPYDYRLISKYSSFLYLMIMIHYKNNLPYKSYLDEFQKIAEKSTLFYPRNLELRLVYAKYLADLYKTDPKTFNFKDKIVKSLEEGEKIFPNYANYYFNEYLILKDIYPDLAKEKLKLAIKKYDFSKEKNLEYILEEATKLKDEEILSEIVKIVENKKLSTQTQEKLEKIKSIFLNYSTSSK